MLTLFWLGGLLSRRSRRLLGAAAGVALTVAVVASLGTFIAASAATMTRRAVAGVPVDWQVQLAPGADAGAVAAAIDQTAPGSTVEVVAFAESAGFRATTGGTEQTTGPGKVLGIGPRYSQQFGAELRPLLGSPDGVLVAQQTAANLHVTVGDLVAVERVGLPPVTVRVDGIVDLPYADSLFQAVGVPAGVAPQAPPDNVLLLPSDLWHRIFDPQMSVRPDSVRAQLHVRLAQPLPADPGTAFVVVQQLARHLEARVAGSGIVGDNLAARLGGVRADALYSRVLFLFLGLPGAVLAGLLTIAVAASGADRRRREQALLRVRGASTATILRLASLEALVVGVAGSALGVALAAMAAGSLAQRGVAADGSALVWTAGAALGGLALALVAVMVPAWHAARRATVVATRAVVGRPRPPLWRRIYLDALCLVVAALAFWQTASSGYQVVLAPEGVAQASVQYQAFLAAVCLWVGVGLLIARLGNAGLARGRAALAGFLRPMAGSLATIIAAMLGRQRVRVARGIVLVALATSFAVSTAIFNTTYGAQSRVDAQLTNGADVTVTGSTASPPSDKLTELRAVPGVVAAQPMQHRAAYVGNDLQDMYGIDPEKIGEATTLADAFFAGGHARSALAALSARPDGVLVSAETANDYQLRPGDALNLRLQDVRDHQYRVVPFHFVGVVREFPTAPKDSFLVANAAYVGRQTGSDAAEIVLVRASGDPAAVAARARIALGPLAGARVTDLGAAQRTIGSSLTAIDAGGLTRLELAFAVLLVTGATGLILALGLAERRQSFVLLAALGATPGQLGSFLWSEGTVILVGGVASGGLLGVAIARMLVTVLVGVFDPPPESVVVPWGYLGLLFAAAIGATVAAVLGAERASRRRPSEALREL